MGEHQIQYLEISTFPSHAIWSFKEDASCTECFIYVDMFTVADTYFNSAQLLESVLLVLESRIERLLTSLKLCNAFLSMQSILSFTGALYNSFATSCQFHPLISNFTCIYLRLPGDVCLIHFSHSHSAYSRLFVHGYWKERLVSLYKWIFYRTLSSLSSLVHLQLKLILGSFQTRLGDDSLCQEIRWKDYTWYMH